MGSKPDASQPQQLSACTWYFDRNGGPAADKQHGAQHSPRTLPDEPERLPKVLGLSQIRLRVKVGRTIGHFLHALCSADVNHTLMYVDESWTLHATHSCCKEIETSMEGTPNAAIKAMYCTTAGCSNAYASLPPTAGPVVMLGKMWLIHSGKSEIIKCKVRSVSQFKSECIT